MGSETTVDGSEDQVRGKGEGEGEGKETIPAAKSKEFGLAAIRRKEENTRAYRELQEELTGLQCEHCGQLGPYRVVQSPKKKEGEKKIRRVGCYACGHQFKLVTEN